MTLSEDGRSDEGISCKMKQRKMIVVQLNSVLRNGKISYKTNNFICFAILENIFSYVSETCEINQRNPRRLQVVEVDFWRSSCVPYRLCLLYTSIYNFYYLIPSLCALSFFLGYLSFRQLRR